MFTYSLVDERGGTNDERISRLYARLPSVDFSRAILQEAGEHMRVLTVPPCGWTDVGTPAGVARCGLHSQACPTERGAALTRAPVDLVEALRAFEDGMNLVDRSAGPDNQ
jgi:hypothetical protein